MLSLTFGSLALTLISFFSAEATPQVILLEPKAPNITLFNSYQPPHMKVDLESLNITGTSSSKNSTFNEYIAFNSTDILDFKATIRDSSGVDVSHKMAIMVHVKVLSSPATAAAGKKDFSKRVFGSVVSRPINYGCPAGYFFSSSRCDIRSAYLKAYRVICGPSHPGRGYPPPTVLYVHGNCDADEVCVNGMATDRLGSPRLAYCAQHGNFVDFIHAGANSRTTNIRAANKGQYSVTALLANDDGESGVEARSMSIHAQSYSAFFNTELWGDLHGGASQCDDCFEVGIAFIPGGTKRIEVDVTLAEGAAGGQLLLALMDLGS